MCVPNIVLKSCQELANKESEFTTIECIAGRDRVDCLDIVGRREADFMAADPEDRYLAFKKKSEDYFVISELRTKIEEQAEFRYEGCMVVKKSSGINKFDDLRGKKSCHNGYARVFGYHIPIVKLKKHNVFKVDNNTDLSNNERELKALSEFFTQSCIVGAYSENREIAARLLKSYQNLCALCEDPAKCDYPNR
jgi:ABC-type phosphate/phosphonate transport system substrate-binding protein